MDVEFQDNKLQEFCEDFKKLKKRYGQIQAQEIIKRINELSSAESLFDISKLPQARLHPLKQNLQGFLAVDLKHPYRLIFLPIDGEIQNYKSITKIKIIKIGLRSHLGSCLLIFRQKGIQSEFSESKPKKFKGLAISSGDFPLRCLNFPLQSLNL